PTCDGATMCPATRMTNRSPNPWPKTSSAGTRESEQPRTIAKGCCPSASTSRRVGLRAGVAAAALATNALLPACNRSSASDALIIGGEAAWRALHRGPARLGASEITQLARRQRRLASSEGGAGEAPERDPQGS